MKNNYKQFDYNITTNPDFQNERYGNPPELVSQMESLFFQSQDKNNKFIIARLIDLIRKFPRSPQLKNFLSAAYSIQGKYEKAKEVNKRIVAEHPDYLFGKINAANELINSGEPGKVTEILGELMEIKDLYPGRDLFHLAEVTGFYKVAIRYFVAIGNFAVAENRFKVLEELAPDHQDTEAAEMLLYPSRLEKAMERYSKEKDTESEIIPARPLPISKEVNPPVFNHNPIQYLYENGLKIEAGKLTEILLLPRQTLIADLEKVLQDATNRFVHFSKAEYNDTTQEFPLHVICLLGELKAESSLPVILDFLESHPDLLEFWFGDHLTGTLWQPIYQLAQNNLPLLKQFILKPGVYTYSKVMVSETMTQIALHHPEKRDEIAIIYEDVLMHFNQAKWSDNLIDSELVALIIGDVIDAGFPHLLPLIKELYDKDYVAFGINGDYQEVVEHFSNPTVQNKREILDIFLLYQKIVTTWDSYKGDENYIDWNDDEEEEPIKQAVSVKIGRNDPCPCGSGKKYKKCCLKDD